MLAKQLAVEAIPLLMVLVGAAFVTFSLGPYNNWDTQLEFEAASNVNKLGIPYVASFGTSIDQPPLGFYVEAFFFAIFGASTATSVTLVTMLGLGSVAVVYLIGREWYGKSAGLLAAAFLGLNPWHIVLSRSGLIDVQCLLLSLLCLYVGIFAIRRASVKLTFFSGLLFAAAFLTKFYAVFILIPLLLYFIYARPKNPKLVLRQVTVFSVPVFVLSFLWYQIVLGRSLLSVFHHNDFLDVVPASVNVVPSPFFATNFLMDYGLGICFLAATAFSLLIGFSFRRYNHKAAHIDLICLATIVLVILVNVVLGTVLNLNVPYFSAIKYLYQALPFFALLAGSLVVKSFLLLRAAKPEVQPKKVLLYLVTATAVLLLVASLVSTLYYTNALSMRDYLQYRVEPQVDYGYALLCSTPLTVDSALMSLQYLGFATVLSGLFLAVMWRLGWLSTLKRIIKA